MNWQQRVKDAYCLALKINCKVSFHMPLVIHHWLSLNNHCLIISGCARASLVLCGGHICHPSLFLRVLRNNPNAKSQGCQSAANSKTSVYYPASVCQSRPMQCGEDNKEPAVHNMGFVRLSNAWRVVPLLAAPGHLLTAATAPLYLCCTVAVKWLVLLWLFVCV